jgi:pimeloyl-ACP methyl ester carboxylesterase
MLQRIITMSLFMALGAAVSGCGYFGYYANQAHWHKNFDMFPSMSALNKIDPEDSLLLQGSIVRMQKRPEPLLVVAVSDRFNKNEIVAMAQLPESATSYLTFLPRGVYTIYVFADLDQDGKFQTEECIGQAQAVVSQEHSRGGIVVEGPFIHADFEHPRETDFRVREAVRPTAYVYASLDDEFFDPRYGAMGLYQPSELIAHTQGFLFSLDRVDEKKTIIIFVHGISGTPRDWKFIVEGLDRNRFQPFFFYYPSGLNLDKLGTLLAETIVSLDLKAENSATIVLAAHSMGGLIALNAIQKLAENGCPSSLKLYCSFSTPYRGDESAKKWIKTAPVVVPVWNDIAADSEFLKRLEASSYPIKPPYYLFFSYHDSTVVKFGESGDGSVSLRSQLDSHLQQAAVRIYGYNETHVSILNSVPARAAFLQLLDSVTPPDKTSPDARH